MLRPRIYPLAGPCRGVARLTSRWPRTTLCALVGIVTATAASGPALADEILPAQAIVVPIPGGAQWPLGLGCARLRTEPVVASVDPHRPAAEWLTYGFSGGPSCPTDPAPPAALPELPDEAILAPTSLTVPLVSDPVTGYHWCVVLLLEAGIVGSNLDERPLAILDYDMVASFEC